MPEHKDLSGLDLHEPKGVASAGAGMVYTADGAGSGTWSAPATPSMAGMLSQGIYDYADLSSTSTPIALPVSTLPAGAIEIGNDGLGASTNLTYPLAGLSNVWDTSTDRWNWVDGDRLSLGDTVDIRIDVEFTTASNDTDIFLWLELGTGAAPYHLELISGAGKKSTGLHKHKTWTGVYMGDANTLNNPGRVLASADKAGCTLVVNGWYARVLHTNA